MSESGSKRFLIHENMLNDMLHDAVLGLYLDLQIFPPFSSDHTWSLLKGGKIANNKLITVQHHVAYRLVCFRV